MADLQANQKQKWTKETFVTYTLELDAAEMDALRAVLGSVARTPEIIAVSDVLEDEFGHEFYATQFKVDGRISLERE